MHWMSVKLPDNFQIREHSRPCLFDIELRINSNTHEQVKLRINSNTHEQVELRINSNTHEQVELHVNST
jgi:hypothetical protein